MVRPAMTAHYGKATCKRLGRFTVRRVAPVACAAIRHAPRHQRRVDRAQHQRGRRALLIVPRYGTAGSWHSRRLGARLCLLLVQTVQRMRRCCAPMCYPRPPIDRGHGTRFRNRGRGTAVRGTGRGGRSGCASSGGRCARNALRRGSAAQSDDNSWRRP
jgi:hypothetical protein